MSASSQDPVSSARDPLGRARRILERVGGSESDVVLASELAEALWEAARELETPAERRLRLRTARLVRDENSQKFAVALTDRACRRPPPERVVDAVGHLEDLLGIPQAVEGWQRWALRALPSLGVLAPRWAAAGIDLAVAKEASAYVVRGEERLRSWLTRQRAGELRINLNYLGEEVVGEEQARRQGERYGELIRRTDVTTLSVKVSSLFSQTSLVAFDESLHVLKERLRPIYRAALAGDPQKLVYLDMEAYRELELTLTLFMELLDEPELRSLKAGVVLQAYLPDSLQWQRRLVDWARRRRAAGGAPVRLRLVKGANLNMERVESSIRGWPVPVLPSKAEVDAQFKHMLRNACQKDALDAIELGVGSHNVFDLAYALVLRQRSGLADSGLAERVQLEMLHGMAEPLRRALQRLDGDVLVYLPAVEARDFPSAVAYLMRRFDENASEENFLRHGFLMSARDREFAAQRERFERACHGFVERASFRVPVRREPFEREVSEGVSGFRNEPDTDPTRPDDRAFLRAALGLVDASGLRRDAEPRSVQGVPRSIPPAPLERVPASVADQERWDGPWAPGFDPSRPGVVPYHHRLTTEAELEEALEAGHRAAQRWAAVPAPERIRLIRAAAQELRRSRQELLRALVLDGARRIEEGDAEVSEAIDFAEYYAASFEELAGEYETAAHGLVVVTPPWNFPLAIPLGGTFAALIAGNAVILKPAIETPLVAYLGAAALWRAGIPRDVLQFVPCRETVGSRLITDPRVSTVVLTGATETARLFRRLRPGLRLLAETGGKNAMIVSALCDPDQAIRDAVRSAFGHAGQKCSALSLLIVEKALYHSDDFRRQLRDAAASLPVGSAWEPQNVVTPLIRPPGPVLARGLGLEPGERWLLTPRQAFENPRLVSPGIKLDVAPGSYTHCAELFGPVLAVLPAEDLGHALRIANGTPYGLTAGFHGLDEREQRLFIEGMQAGNLYINRTMTGAIVGRQPFGGQKASSFGPGAKAGGPHYVAQFCSLVRKRAAAKGASVRGNLGASGGLQGLAADIRGALSREGRERLDRRWRDYLEAFEQLADARLLQQLVGEANWFRLCRSRVAVLLGACADPVDVASILGIGHLLAAPLELFVVGDGEPWWHERLVIEGRAQKFRSLADLSAQKGREMPRRIRSIGIDEAAVWAAFGASDAHLEAEPVSDFGRVELLRYLVEQSVSISQHRYGNLGMAEFSPRPNGLR